MASNQQIQQPAWATYEPTKDCSQGFCSIYCPQWCYIIFPPPPPFSFEEPDDTSTSSGGTTFSPLVIAIIGILATAFLLISYYTVVSKYCRRRRRRNRNPVGPDNADADPTNRRHEDWHASPAVGLDEVLISKITVCKYKRGDGLVDCTDCSVCLGEFREDESLRLLPKCSHAFHVECIDTWLRSHSNCPLCRANIVVLSQQLPALPPPPETNRSDDETVVAIGEAEEGTSLENDSDTSSKEILILEGIEIRDGNGDQRMRRSFSMGSFGRSRVSVADILQLDLEDEDPEILVGSGSSSEQGRGEHSKGRFPRPTPMKRSVSSGRFCLTRQGRGRNSVLPM